MLYRPCLPSTAGVDWFQDEPPTEARRIRTGTGTPAPTARPGRRRRPARVVVPGESEHAATLYEVAPADVSRGVHADG